MRPRNKNRHLPSCVYLQHGAYWLVKKGKWIPLGKDQRSALEEYARRMDQPEGTMPALIDEALANLKDLSDGTKKDYRIAGEKLKYSFKAFKPEQVDGATVWEYRDSHASTPNMTNRCLSLLRQVFDYAVRRGRLRNNPTVGVDRLPENQRDRLISPEEFKHIYEKADARLQVIMDLYFLTGQRVKDVLRIRRADIGPEGIYFKQQKTDQKLLVRWTPELREVVDRAKNLSGNVAALTLLHNSRGKPPGYLTIWKQWHRATALAGVTDAQMRDLRAMSLTEAEEQGKNPTALAGHASPATTKRYLRRKKIPKVEGPSIRQSNRH